MKGNITRRGKTSWRLKFDIGRDTCTGRRIIKFVTVRGTRKEAEAKLTDLLHDLGHGKFVEPAKVTVTDYLREWLKGLDVSPKTHERYTEIVEKHLIPTLGSHPLPQLKPMQIKVAWNDALNNGRRDGRGGLSPQTVLHHHRVLSKALSEAVQLEMLYRNPAKAVTPPKPESPRIRTLNEAEIAHLLKTADGMRMHMPVLLAVTTGMRMGEILGLGWKDVDFEGAAVTVTRSLEQTRAGLRLKQPKTKRSRRRIPLPSLTVEALRRHDVEQKKERLQLGLGSNKDTLVFTRFDGAMVNPRNFSKEFGRLAARAGMPEVTFHGLRHSHITALLRAGVHPKIASERAGHSSVAITMDIYSHVMPDMQAEAVNLVDAALRGALEK